MSAAPNERNGDAIRKVGSGERPRPRPLDALTILAVEDVEDALFLMSELLEAAGAEVHRAGSAREALEMLDDGLVPQLIVSDIGMPDMDGYEMLETIRQRPLPFQPPALAVTAFTRRRDRIRAMRAGFQGHVAKPADAEEIIATLASLAMMVPRHAG